MGGSVPQESPRGKLYKRPRPSPLAIDDPGNPFRSTGVRQNR